VEALEVPIPPLHFGRRARGKLDDKTGFFSGKFSDLDSFVPKNLSWRIVASKMGSIYDILGKFVPITIGLKADLRKVVLATSSWDEAMLPDLRSKWIQDFWKLEQLRGIKFHRPRMPDTAVDKSMRLITAVDAALESIIIGSWGCFRLRGGGWSSQLILGRGLLAPPNGTIPKNELEGILWWLKYVLGH